MVKLFFQLQQFRNIHSFPKRGYAALSKITDMNNETEAPSYDKNLNFFKHVSVTTNCLLHLYAQSHNLLNCFTCH